MLFFSGGFGVVSLGNNRYGNNVTFRTAHLPSGAQKSWIDFEAVLPAGVLEKYYIYIHKVTVTTTSDTTTRIRLHIWRPVHITEHLYQLVWSRTVEVDIKEEIGLFYTVSMIQSLCFCL